MRLFDEVIEELEAALAASRAELGPDLPSQAVLDIRVVGQMSLLMNDELTSQIRLARTNDVDALISGKWEATKIFRDILLARGLVFDELSGEVWIPSDATFHRYYESSFLTVSFLDPISALTSKAIKAKEKNKSLITAALKVYGARLAENIIRYGGDIRFFDANTKITL